MKHEIRTIVRSKLRQRKRQTVLQCSAIALSAAMMFVIVSLCMPFIGYFTAQANRFQEDPRQMASSGVMNYLHYIEYFVKKAAEEEAAAKQEGNPMEIISEIVTQATVSSETQKMLKDEGAKQPHIAHLFSQRALVENLPVSVLVALLLCLLAAKASVSVVFSAYQKEQRRFYASLLVAGADSAFVKQSALTEHFYLLSAGIPAGLGTGLAELLLLRAAAAVFFRRHGISPAPVTFRPSLIGACAAVVLVFWFALRCSRKTYKKLSIKNGAFNHSSAMHVNIGNRTFSAKESAYRRHGIEHFVATRNFSGRINQYMRIFFLTILFISFCALPPVFFAFAKNYILAFTQRPKQWLSEYVCTVELLFYLISAVVAVVALAAAFHALTASIAANTGEYVLMRSVGSSMRAIRRTVRIEGVINVTLGIVLGLFPTYWLIHTVFSEYGETEVVSLRGADAAMPVLLLLILLYSFVSALAVHRANRRLGQVDLVQTLKDVSY